MLSAIALLILNGSVTSTEENIPRLSLPNLFVAACIDSNLRFSTEDASEVGFNGLPRELRERLGKPANGQVWRLHQPGNAYFYTLNYDGGEKNNPRICGVASDEMDLAATRDLVSARLTGDNHRDELVGEWVSPQAGYRAFVTKAGKFKVAQVNWLSDKQRAQVLDSYKIAQ